MDLESGPGGSVSAAAIDSSNIGFQVLSLSSTVIYILLFSMFILTIYVIPSNL